MLFVQDAVFCPSSPRWMLRSFSQTNSLLTLIRYKWMKSPLMAHFSVPSNKSSLTKLIFRTLERHLPLLKIKSKSMCKVAATKYSQCAHTCRFRLREACEAGFSCFKLSCREDDNEIVDLTVSDQKVCFGCYTERESDLRSGTETTVQKLVLKGEKGEMGETKVIKECKKLRKAESNSLMRLRIWNRLAKSKDLEQDERGWYGSK